MNTLTKTAVLPSNTRLNIVTSAPAPKPEATVSPVLKLNKEQSELMPNYILAKAARAEAERAENQLAKAIGLPRYEGKAQSVQILNHKGKHNWTIQVAMRMNEARPASVSWINKLVSL